MTHGRTSTKTRTPARVAMAALAAVATTGAMVALTGPAHAAGAALPANCTTTGVTTTCTFTFTGAAQQLTVPTGVTAVVVTAEGGHGATPAWTPSGVGGKGARVLGTFPVSAGDQLKVLVAGDASGARGGFGYGTGGTSEYAQGGGGGGASSVSNGSTLLVVAAGGGGGGTGGPCGNGGAGGNARSNGQVGQVTAPECQGAKGAAGGLAGASASANGESAPNINGLVGGAGGAGYVGGKAGSSGGLAMINSALVAIPGGGGGGGTVFANQQIGRNMLLSGITDRAAGQNGQVTIAFSVPDAAAPVAHPTVTPGPNANGWNKTPVTVDWGWTDIGAGINPNACTLKTQPGTREGIYTVFSTCADNAGNTNTAQVTIKQDATAPVLVSTSGDHSQGSSVTYGWTWADDGSGLDPAHCTTSLTASAPNWSGTLTATCVDLAGNSSSDSRAYTIDYQAPYDYATFTPEPNAAGWNNSDVTIDWNWVDPGIGIDPATCPAQTTVTAEGTTDVEMHCSDLFGNSDNVGYDVRIDKTMPVADPAVSLTASGATVDWNWTDPNYDPNDRRKASGIDPDNCVQTSTQSGTGALTFTSSCTDIAGNTATKSVTLPKRADVKVAVTGTTAVKKGSSYTYTVTVTNNGPGVASNVVSGISWPAGATLVSASGTPVKTATSSTWTTASLASGASKTFTVKLKFTTTGAKALAATAWSQVNGSTPATPDGNTGNNQAQLTATVS